MLGSRVQWVITFILVLLVAIVAMASRGRGLSARREAWPGEERLMRFARAWMLPAEYRRMTTPVAPTPEALRAGMEHWADHCAVCHGNDGSGRVAVGRGLFPRALDMRAATTQDQSDGALFYAIEEGVPFTGMPAWSTGTTSGERESWELVLFIRHLPQITTDELAEMEKLNPKSAAREQFIEDFLEGGK